jgi:hypothetical protein
VYEKWANEYFLNIKTSLPIIPMVLTARKPGLSAEISQTINHRTEKAKLLYEKIIFNHEDSIYFIEGRKYGR